VDQTPERALDEYLVLLSQAGSIEALDGLTRRWTPRLLRYAARVLGGSGDAAETARDVVQETWIGAIRGLRGLRDPAQFPAWIYGIATRKCADAVRANRRRRSLDRQSAAGGSRQDPGLPAEDQIDLATAIRGLPPTHRSWRVSTNGSGVQPMSPDLPPQAPSPKPLPHSPSPHRRSPERPRARDAVSVECR
jgi:RNA polymerase sigma-70 factor (ECF subfamily)